VEAWSDLGVHACHSADGQEAVAARILTDGLDRHLATTFEAHHDEMVMVGDIRSATVA